MLSDLDPSPRRDEGCRRRDVEGAKGISTGPDDVDERFSMDAFHHDGGAAHAVGKARDLVGGLPLHSEAHEEGGDLHVVDLSADQLV